MSNKNKKYIYFFSPGKADGNGKMKELLGGKGAGLAEMARSGAPVAAGFTITTEVCRYYYKHNKTLPPDFPKHFENAIQRLQKITAKEFGNPHNPLLVSVRSGAKFSMPGMMDTILNLGMNEEVVEGLAKLTNNPRFAYDCYRRFIQMFGNVVMGIEKNEFEQIIQQRKKSKKINQDVELDAQDLQYIIKKFKQLYKKHTNEEFPQDPFIQLQRARDAVFRSWDNPRAQQYRKINKIPDDLGTAVNIQQMVFGNMGDDSATGVGFTRNPSTGEKEFYGEFLPNAQGEDVVAGIRTPLPIEKLKEMLPKAYSQLKTITTKLEKHYRDVQDFEFTIERSKLYMLQTRTGKRTGIAAVKIAVDMVKEKLITEKEALMRVEPDQIAQLLAPVFDSKKKEEVIKKGKLLAKGLNAGPGAASGKIVFSAEKAVKESKNYNVILVRPETNPDDVAGMYASKGILTTTGGMTSHAAVVARGAGIPCVVGCSVISIDEKNLKMSVNGQIFKEGDNISIDGFTGEVIGEQLPTLDSEIIRVLKGEISSKDSQLYRYFSTFISWADKYRKLKIRANADRPQDAKLARLLGAEGIGLARTEHMFFEEDRIPKMLKMILAETIQQRKQALDELFPLQKEDFKGLFREMKGYGVTIRTIDPPLHEFIPKTKEEAESRGRELKIPPEKIWDKASQLHEFNPMLGHRGCRLGITYPEITQMQTRAIISAACELLKFEKIKVIPEIMIPLVGTVEELKDQKDIVNKVAQEVMKEYKVTIDYMVGTMIEVPRAAITADEIAKEAEFFSFGTNDLTQMTYGFSRDDAGKFIRIYLDKEILKSDPFQTIDLNGVGKLMEIGVRKGRKTRKNLKIGICGEHGGDPDSIKFCHKLGLDYVSCSPFRTPIARLAAARASIEEKQKIEYTSK